MDFEFPDTGEGVTEGKFLEWTVEEGEEVEEDQVIAEVETDKAVIDVPAPADGIITELLASPGDNVQVGEVIMKMKEGEEVEVEGKEKKEEVEETKDETEEEQEDSEEKMGSEEDTSITSNDVLALPKVRKLAEEKGVDLSSIDKEGRITEEDVRNASGEELEETVDEAEEPEEKEGDHEETSESKSTNESSGDYSEVKATPSVRKLAREKGVNLENVEGSGRDGKIIRDDVIEASEEHQEKQEKKKVDKVTTETSKDTEDAEIVEMSQMRKTVASRMEESRFSAPHVTHVEKADVTYLADMREKAKEKVDEHLTYLPFIIKAVEKALEEHPDLNAEYNKEDQEIIRYKNYDFNIAVDTDEGLLIPVIEDVDDKSIVDLAGEISDKAERARNMDLEVSELENGTFSITNLGVIGGEEFTPIINYPQVAILGIGKISETAEVVEGEVQPRKTVKLSLSYDHRVVDGAEAARFMNVIVENLENPNELLLNL